VLEFLDAFTDWGAAGDAWRGVLADPQTSGGLLVAVADGRAHELVAAVAAKGGSAVRIGRVVDGDSGAVRLR
jgi:selenide,water dikinase